MLDSADASDQFPNEPHGVGSVQLAGRTLFWSGGLLVPRPFILDPVRPSTTTQSSTCEVPVFDWEAPVFDWKVPVFDWEVPMIDWKVHLFDWKVLVCAWEVPVCDWKVPVCDWKVPVFDWKAPVFD